MVEIGQTIDLSSPVHAVVDGRKWEGLLSDLVKRPTIISVYMKNNTSSCDRQVSQLQKIGDDLDALGIGLIGLSKDTVGSHLKYAGKYTLSFPLVSDEEHSFAKASGSLIEKKMYGKSFWGPTRSAYFVDPHGKVLGLVDKVDSANHSEQIMKLAMLKGE